MAYLTASLLIDTSSELTIMVTATIQADLKSDNFLTVSTALQAICATATSELISVFLPQVTALLKHDKDAVKKKALLVVHRFLQLDPGLAPEVDRLLVDRVGYKEPSVMMAALPGLKELIDNDPKSYKKLLPFFLNILKQATEGRLGRAYEYHQAPAPFLQLSLLRLLLSLSMDDASAASNAMTVIGEVMQRGHSLGNTVGNAIVLECVRTIAAMKSPPPQLVALAAGAVAQFLASKDNNLKYAGLDGLSRLVHIDSSHVAKHQLALVDCLRSADETLRRKTLTLLYSVASPSNIDLITDEALKCLKDEESTTSDDVSRRAAVVMLCEALQQHSPTNEWYVDMLTEVLEVAGEAAPASASKALLYAINHAEGNAVEDAAFRCTIVEKYMQLLSAKAKLPAELLHIICWVVGEYGVGSGSQSVERMMDALANIPDTHTSAATDVVKMSIIAALGKLSVQSGEGLTSDAKSFLENAAHAPELALQQRAVEVKGLLSLPQDARVAALPKYANLHREDVDPNLTFLAGYVAEAEAQGAAPYLTKEQRNTLGMSRSTLHTSGTSDAAFLGAGGGLKFEAYQVHTAPAVASQPAIAADFDLGGVGVVSSSSQAAVPVAQPASFPSPVAAGPPQLMLSRATRKWGPSSGVVSEPNIQLPQEMVDSVPPRVPTSAYPWNQPQPTETLVAVVDPEKQRLASSLFGASPSPQRQARPARSRSAQLSPAKEIDLLGGLVCSATEPQEQHTGGIDSNVVDLLGALEGPAAPPSAAAPNELFFGLNDVTAPAAPRGLLDFDDFISGSTTTTSVPPPNGGGIPKALPSHNKDPFADLLG